MYGSTPPPFFQKKNDDECLHMKTKTCQTDTWSSLKEIDEFSFGDDSFWLDSTLVLGSVHVLFVLKHDDHLIPNIYIILYHDYQSNGC